VCNIVVKNFTFAISSPDEFLSPFLHAIYYDGCPFEPCCTVAYSPESYRRILNDSDNVIEFVSVVDHGYE